MLTLEHSLVETILSSDIRAISISITNKEDMMFLFTSFLNKAEMVHFVSHLLLKAINVLHFLVD